MKNEKAKDVEGIIFPNKLEQFGLILQMGRAFMGDDELALSQDQVAKEAGISVPTLRKMEKGESAKLKTFLRVLDTLGLELTLTIKQKNYVREKDKKTVTPDEG